MFCIPGPILDLICYEYDNVIMRMPSTDPSLNDNIHSIVIIVADQ